MMTTLESFRWSVGLALGILVGLAAGCKRDGTSDARVSRSCEAYCANAVACDDEVDEDDCVLRCEDNMTDCMADEQEHALDDLDDCSEESCDDVTTCTIGVGLQCTFGL